MFIIKDSLLRTRKKSSGQDCQSTVHKKDLAINLSRRNLANKSVSSQSKKKHLLNIQNQVKNFKFKIRNYLTMNQLKNRKKEVNS